MSIVFSNNKVTTLDTFLNETAFSRTVNGLNFTEKGNHVSFNLFNNDFNFSDWNFDGTCVDQNTSHVCFEGKGFGGKTGLELINGKDKEKATRFVYALIKLLSKAIQTNHSISKVGLGGILYKETFSKKKSENIFVEFLFLPENLFELASLNQDEKTYSNLQGFWQNKALTDKNALIFTQSVTAYYSLSEIFPFMKTSTQERQEDIIDSNFIEIQNVVNGINESLASDINMGFRIDNQYQRDKALIPLDILQKELGLNPDGTVSPKQRPDKISQEKFIEKIQQQNKTNERKTARKRFFKRYWAALLAACAALALVSNLSYKSYLENLEKPSAKNLSSIEAIQTFYSGYHKLDASLMRLVAKGRNVNGICDMISNIYVTSTTRQAYAGKYATITPELYFTRPELMEYWIFGITDFKIDDKSENYFFEPQQKKDTDYLKKMNQLKKFNDGETENHKISFYQLSSSGLETPLTVIHYTGELTCTYKKDQWYLTDIKLEQSDEQFELQPILKEYNEQYLKTQDTRKTLDELRKKYKWLPDDAAMEHGKELAEYQKNYFK